MKADTLAHNVSLASRDNLAYTYSLANTARMGYTTTVNNTVRLAYTASGWLQHACPTSLHPQAPMQCPLSSQDRSWPAPPPPPPPPAPPAWPSGSKYGNVLKYDEDLD